MNILNENCNQRRLFVMKLTSIPVFDSNQVLIDIIDQYEQIQIFIEIGGVALTSTFAIRLLIL